MFEIFIRISERVVNTRVVFDGCEAFSVLSTEEKKEQPEGFSRGKRSQASAYMRQGCVTRFKFCRATSNY